jgi:NMD protein affecting ribosome stability and mRNA decay
MTVHVCIRCGCTIEKLDSSVAVIRGLCPECYSLEPYLLGKVPDRLPQRGDKDHWRRY